MCRLSLIGAALLLISAASATVTINVQICPTSLCYVGCAQLDFPNTGACVASDTSGSSPRNWIYTCSSDLQTVHYQQWNNNTNCGGSPKYIVNYQANATICQPDQTDGNYKIVTCIGSAAQHSHVVNGATIAVFVLSALALRHSW